MEEKTPVEVSRGMDIIIRPGEMYTLKTYMIRWRGYSFMVRKKPNGNIRMIESEV